ncbi:MAG: hypothetical protein KF861_08455, partial [Planctomycetaceae bacterium]|nr:hypothetical protein [Planctomycetaceae bacterium]
MRIRDAHLVGIGGSGMRALAELIRGFQVRVTGSDCHLTQDDFWQMHRRGLRVFRGHAASHVPDDADVLIYSPAVSADNPERQEAARRGIPQFSLSEAIGRMMKGRVGVSVAGTHGKSTTTALIGHLLDLGGKRPSVLTGAEILGLNASGRAGRSDLLVVESCEYRQHFLSLAPQHAVLLNIEPDHFDCFRTLQNAIDTFRQFAAKVPDNGTLLVNYDSATALAAVRDA